MGVDLNNKYKEWTKSHTISYEGRTKIIEDD
jgi:hypothetical protein